MALQIWLPLINDLHNQGLSEVSVTVNGTTTFSEGKLGQALSGNGSSYWTISPITLGTTASVCWWGMTTDTNAMFWVLKANVYADLNFWLYNGKYYLNVGDSLNNPFQNNGADVTGYSDGLWHHYAVTFNGSVCSLYIDGAYYAKAKTYKSPATPSGANVRIAGGFQNAHSYDTEGRINDFRVFDHCLSAKEVKEISKGLVQHFKLSESYGMVNMVKGGYLIYNNYGTGMTVTQETLSENYLGEPILRCTYTPNTTACADAFKSGYHSRGVYTSDTYYAGASGTSKQFTYWIYYRPRTSGLTAGGTASNMGGWTEIPSEYMGDGWYRVGQKRTVNSHATLTSDRVFTSLNWPYAGVGSSCTIDWGPDYLISGSTTIADHFIEGDATVYDCSGYGNDGLAVNRPSPTTAVRYGYGNWFSSNRYIRAYRGGMIRDAITVSIWAYMSSWSSYNTRMFSCTEGGGWNFEPSSSKMHFSIGTGVSANTYTSVTSNRTLASLGSGWHHFVGTWDGFSSRVYIDGVLAGTNTAYTERTPVFYNSANGVFIGAEAGGTQTTPAGSYFNGGLSDFRIYATALSDEDVAELYHTAASVDNHGNFFCGEIIEK